MAFLWEAFRAQLIKLTLVSLDKPSAEESSCLCPIPCAQGETDFPLPSLFHSASVNGSVCFRLGLMRAAVVAGPCWTRWQIPPNSVFISKLLLTVLRNAAEKNKAHCGAMWQSLFSVSWVEKAFIADSL